MPGREGPRRPAPPDLELSGDDESSVSVTDSPTKSAMCADSPGLSSCLSSCSNNQIEAESRIRERTSSEDSVASEVPIRGGELLSRISSKQKLHEDSNETPRSEDQDGSTPTGWSQSQLRDYYLDATEDNIPQLRQVKRGAGQAFLRRRHSSLKSSGKSPGLLSSRVSFNSEMLAGLGVAAYREGTSGNESSLGTSRTSSSRSSIESSYIGHSVRSKISSAGTSKRSSTSVPAKPSPKGTIPEEDEENMGVSDEFCQCGQPWGEGDLYCQNCRAERPMRREADITSEVPDNVSGRVSQQEEDVPGKKRSGSIAWEEWREEFPMELLNTLAYFYEDCAVESAKGRRKATLKNLQDCLGKALGLLPDFIGTEAEARGLIATGTEDTEVVFPSFKTLLVFVSGVVVHAEKETPAVLWPEADYQILLDVFTQFANASSCLPMGNLFDALEALNIEELSTAGVEQQRWLVEITRTVMAERVKTPSTSGRRIDSGALSLRDFTQIATVALRGRERENRLEDFAREREVATRAGFGPLQVEDLRELFITFNGDVDSQDEKNNGQGHSHGDKQAAALRSHAHSAFVAIHAIHAFEGEGQGRNNLARMLRLFARCGVRELRSGEVVALRAILRDQANQPGSANAEEDGPFVTTSSTSLSAEVSFEHFLLWMHTVFQQGIGDLSFEEQSVPTLEDLESHGGFVACMLRERLTSISQQGTSGRASIQSAAGAVDLGGEPHFSEKRAENVDSCATSRRSSNNSSIGLAWAMRKSSKQQLQQKRAAAGSRRSASKTLSRQGSKSTPEKSTRGEALQKGSRPPSASADRHHRRTRSNSSGSGGGSKGSRRGSKGSKGSRGSRSGSEDGQDSRPGSASGSRSRSGKRTGCASPRPDRDSGVLLLTGLPPSEAMLARKAYRAISVDHTNAPLSGMEGLLPPGATAAGDADGSEPSRSGSRQAAAASAALEQRLQMHMQSMVGGTEGPKKSLANRQVKTAQDAKTLVDHAMQKLANLQSEQDGDDELEQDEGE